MIAGPGNVLADDIIQEKFRLDAWPKLQSRQPLRIAKIPCGNGRKNSRLPEHAGKLRKACEVIYTDSSVRDIAVI